MNLLFNFFLFLSVSTVCSATGQIPDYLIIEKDTIPIFTNPLEQYFEKKGNRELPEFNGCGSTACWRGYKAIWRLEKDSLFLLEITSCHSKNHCMDAHNADLEQMFGIDFQNNRVFASWFSGDIMAPMGELVYYVHMGYGSVYEDEKYYTFVNGIKIKERTKSNKKIANKVRYHMKEMTISKKAQDTLFYYLKNKISWDTTTTVWYKFCDEKYILTYSRSGKIKKTWIEWTFDSDKLRDKLDNWWWNMTEDRKCRRVVKKAIKPLKLSYLDLPGKEFKITVQVFYDRKSGEIELWKEYWMEDED